MLLSQLLRNRGPDISHHECISQPNSYQIHLSGHVLWTQGQHPVQQPISQESKFFLFNGDIYSFGKKNSPHSIINEDHMCCTDNDNDGARLFKLLANYSTDYDDDDDNQLAHHFMPVIGSLEGPFAFLFYDHERGELWFGRDFLEGKVFWFHFSKIRRV